MLKNSSKGLSTTVSDSLEHLQLDKLGSLFINSTNAHTDPPEQVMYHSDIYIQIALVGYQCTVSSVTFILWFLASQMIRSPALLDASPEGPLNWSLPPP